MTKKSLFSDQKLIIYTDGGSRNNPGHAAAGFVVGSHEYGEYLGERTNNYAEYMAVILALKKAKHLLGGKKAEEAELEVRMDSELVARQLGGKYKIKEPDLKPLFVDVWNLKMDFKKVEFAHIPREQNKRADRMVNRTLDEHAR
ncbi:MAG: ribonuclease HI family protein [Patescibacteria group bacterium]